MRELSQMKISVIIPTYNRYERVKRAIMSVLNQSYKAYEVIVVDDGSEDLTCKIKDEFKSIKYFYKANGGVSSARNLGIQKASGEWVAFLDDDDEWEEDKLALQIALHVQNPSLHVSYTDEKWIRDKKQVNVPKKYQKFSGYIYEKCLSHCIIAPSSVMIRKSLFDEIGLFDESLEVCEDYDLWLRITCKYPVGLVSKALIIKHAGEDEQLGFKYWGMDRFRVRALEKILTALKDEEQRKLTCKVLAEKLELLMRGAKKHGRAEIAKEYEDKIKNLNQIYM